MKFRLFILVILALLLAYWSYFSITFEYNAESMQLFFQMLGYTAYTLLVLVLFYGYKIYKAVKK